MGAVFDSEERHPAPKCLPGTRGAVLTSIMDTLSYNNCYLEGMAGWGKSAVAQSIAERLDVQERLAASFFFARGKTGRNEIKYLFPTIAYQLTIFIPSLRTPIADAITSDPSILYKSPPRQLQKLIIEPISTATRLPSFMVVVIDAIDECENEESAADIISLVIDARLSAGLPFRFLITIRPEPRLRAILYSNKIGHLPRILSLQDFDAEDDIRIFLRHRFDEISTTRNEMLRGVKLPWPSESDFESLVQKSSGLFIFAVTVMNFLDDRNAHPIRRLEMALMSDPNASISVYAALDQLYIHILSNTPNIDILRDILGAILTLFDPLPIQELEQLLSLPSGVVSLALTGLNSILVIPSASDQPVSIFHESLRDFLSDAKRSHRYFIDIPRYHADMAHSCLDVLAKYFKQDYRILELGESSSSWACLYACDYWASHLRYARYSNALVDDLDTIADETLLFWIEAVSRSYHLDGALVSLRMAKKWLRSHQNNKWLTIWVSMVLDKEH